MVTDLLFQHTFQTELNNAQHWGKKSSSACWLGQAARNPFRRGSRDKQALAVLQ